MALLPFRIWACSLVLVASFAALGGCQANAPSKAVVSIELPDTVSVDDRIAEILSQHKINTAGFAVIQNERVVWQKVFEDQSTGVPASDETLFNIASITKTVIAETVLRLAAAGRITLDGPMSDHWLDPDLVDDLRHMQLTPRHVLTHRTGFPNWRFFTDSGKLQFVSDPGQGFGYSGEGFNYLAKFVESKLDTPFEDLARQNVLDPAGVSEAALSVNPKLFLRLAEALDADDNFPGHYCRPDGWCREAGSFSAAGGMAIT
ncbi:MAG: serine hydrolase domain-containing protein, partial [Pseudomonadota bacterium]